MLLLNKMISKLAMHSGNGFKTCYALNKMGLDNICWKKCWVWEVSLAVYARGKHILIQTHYRANI